MKKKYVKPSVEVIKMESECLLAGSGKKPTGFVNTEVFDKASDTPSFYVDENDGTEKDYSDAKNQGGSWSLWD